MANKRKYSRKQNDQHVLAWVQIFGSAVSTGLLCKYYWENIKKVNPQIENDWNWKKQQWKQKFKNIFNRD